MKLLMGPKEASMMALEVLTKVLQLTAEEKDKCMAKLKWSLEGCNVSDNVNDNTAMFEW